MEKNKQIPVLIPAYNPNEMLLAVVDDLINYGFEHIIIVNDGSKSECRPIFTKLESIERCHVIHHAVNLGKGRAIKTGLNYFYLNFKDSKGVITADADGQHLPEDIYRVAETFQKNDNKLVLGVRQFGKEVPLRSLIGNVLTRFIFRVLIGRKISDTQTGLRCIPTSAVPELLRLAGEGYEYEMNMLILTKERDMDITEEKISTVYIDNNRASHFNPLIDSMKIYFLLFRFSLSSLFTTIIDFAVFWIAFKLSTSILTSMIVARFFSVNINFAINKKIVFHNTSEYYKTIFKFYAAAIVMGTLSFSVIKYLHAYAGIDVILAKATTETFFFIFSFMLQRDIIFSSTTSEE